MLPATVTAAVPLVMVVTWKVRLAPVADQQLLHTRLTLLLLLLMMMMMMMMMTTKAEEEAATFLR